MEALGAAEVAKSEDPHVRTLGGGRGRFQMPSFLPRA